MHVLYQQQQYISLVEEMESVLILGISCQLKRESYNGEIQFVKSESTNKGLIVNEPYKDVT